jgi:hypothetical protein
MIQSSLKQGSDINIGVIYTCLLSCTLLSIVNTKINNKYWHFDRNVSFWVPITCFYLNICTGYPKPHISAKFSIFLFLFTICTTGY